MTLSKNKYADILLRMHQTACLNFDRRRSYEWKLSLGIWAAAGAFIALSLGRDVDLERLTPLAAGFIIVAAAVVLVQFFFLLRLKLGNDCDRARAVNCECLLDTMLTETFGTTLRGAPGVQEAMKRTEGWSKLRGWWAIIFHMTITLALVGTAGCIAFLFRAPQQHGPPISVAAEAVGSRTRGESVSLLFSGLVAFGTIGLALVTVFQDRIRVWLARPRVQIGLHPAKQCYSCPLRDPQGREMPTYWFGLAVTNERPSRTALNCQVLLEEMYRWDGAAKRWASNSPPIPYPYVWAPGHLRNASRTVRTDAVFDFGRIRKREMVFMPELQYRAIEYDPSLKPGATGLYVLRVEAEHLPRGHQQVWEVHWDGNWDDDAEAMAKHFQMKEVRLEECQRIIQQGTAPGDGQ